MGESAPKRGSEKHRKAVTLGSDDASDVMVAELCIISIMKGFGDFLDKGHRGLEWRQGPTYTRKLAFVPLLRYMCLVT